MATDEHFMALALREAEKGRYTTHPNPRVGCVLVKGGEVIAKGFHARAGDKHAEAHVLSQLQPGQAEGATAYVTLEPCSYFGRTPSCADALVEQKLARVVYAMQDPHPKNRGAGLERLRTAGIRVDGPLLEAAARQLNPGHVKRHESGLPFVRLKLAMSLDGKTALANGESRWITAAAARQDVQKLRAEAGAIITGVQTVIEDDPRLSVRTEGLAIPGAELAGEIPRKVVILDSRGRVPVEAQILKHPGCVVATLSEALQLPVPVWHCRADATGRIDLVEVLQKLTADDVSEVLVECGATLAGSFLSAELVDELVVYVAPRLLGGGARELLEFGPLQQLQDALSLRFTDIRAVGEDLRLTAVPDNSLESG